MAFASDNWSGASAPVAQALSEANEGLAPAYGGDPWTERALEALSAFFERPVGALFVATGSAANAIALAEAYRPGGVTLAHVDSHIARDEAGAPLLFAPGMVLDLLDGPAGRIDRAALEARLSSYGAGSARQGRVTALSLTNVNELGGVYDAVRTRELTAPAVSRGVAVHLDGARFANALAATGATPADLTWRGGVDVLSLGFTKTGGWCAEAVVTFEPEAAKEAAFRHKQAAQLFSKNRFVAAQFCALLADGHAVTLARHANERAQEVAAVIERSDDGALAVPCEANEVFAFVSPGGLERLGAAQLLTAPWELRSAHAPQPPQPDWTLRRFVTSHRTGSDEIEALSRALP